jgi:hypothetical protein
MCWRQGERIAERSSAIGVDGDSRKTSALSTRRYTRFLGIHIDASGLRPLRSPRAPHRRYSWLKNLWNLSYLCAWSCI